MAAALGWRTANPTSAVCVGCRHDLPVNAKGACRLCWRQAKLVRQEGQPLDVVDANRDGRQLFFANMHSFKRRVRPITVAPRPPVPYGPRRPRSRAKEFHQLTLQPVPIIATARRFGFPDPLDPKLAAVLDALVEHGASHGWSLETSRRVRLAIRVLSIAFQCRSPGPASEVASLVAFGLPARPVLAVLAGAEMLDDDRADAIETWFDRQVQVLPEPMRNELRIWFEILRCGSPTSPRSRPRDAVTIRTRVNWSLPTLRPGQAKDTARCVRSPTRTSSLPCPEAGTLEPLSVEPCGRSLPPSRGTR